MDYFFQKIKLNFRLKDDLNRDFLYIEWIYIDFITKIVLQKKIHIIIYI